MSNSLFGSAEAEEKGSSASDSAVGKIFLLILSLPLIPAVIFGFGFYWFLLRNQRLKRSMSGLIALLTVVFSYVALTALDGISRALVVVKSPLTIADNWTELLYLLIPLSVGLGSIIGYGIILWDVRDIKNNPHRVELPGFWTYKIQWRKTPLELWKKKKALAALRSGELISDDRAPLGYEEEKDRVAYRFASESIRHTLVTGAAGSGKTISMLSMMRADIESGRTVIAVDFKRSPEFAAKLAAWAEEFGVPFYHFEKGNPESYRIAHSLGQSTYDPFASGSGSEMVLNMREYDSNSAVYKEAMQQLLQVIFAMMEQADRSKAPNVDWTHGGIYQLASALVESNMKDLLVACEGKPIFYEAQNYVPLVTSGKGIEKDTVEKLRGQMRTIVASAYGRWFKIGDGSRNIDLLKMMTGDQTIVLFSFNSEDEPELSRYVGSMIFADLRACSSHIRNRKAAKITNIYVDEFQAVPPTAVNGLLEKARESKFAMTLAQQAFEQIITSSESNGEAYLQSILVTCSNFLTHAGMTQDSAERVSKLLGKEWKTVYSRTNKSDGGFLKNNFSNRRNQIVSASNQEIWKVEPSEFMALSAPTPSNGQRSTAILVSKAVADPNIEVVDGTIARKLWMVPPNCVLEEYVTPYTGDEVDLNAQYLYAEDGFTLLSDEKKDQQKIDDDNTPVYREDSELISFSKSPSSGGWSASNSENEGFENEARANSSLNLPENEFEDFEDFGSYDSDEEDSDGDFDFEPIEPEPSYQHPQAELTESLAAFDSAPPISKVASIAPVRRPSSSRSQSASRKPASASRETAAANSRSKDSSNESTASVINRQPAQQRAPQRTSQQASQPRAVQTQRAQDPSRRESEGSIALPDLDSIQLPEPELPRLGRKYSRPVRIEDNYAEESLPEI